MIIILCLLFLILAALAVYAFFLRRDNKKSNKVTDRAIKAAEAATAAAEASAAANRELYAVLLKQNQQLQSAGVAAEAIPPLPPPDGRSGGTKEAPSPVEGAQEWMATGDFVSNTYYEHYGTKRTVEHAGIQLSDVNLSVPVESSSGATPMPKAPQRGGSSMALGANNPTGLAQPLLLQDQSSLRHGTGRTSPPTNPQDHFMGS